MTRHPDLRFRTGLLLFVLFAALYMRTAAPDICPGPNHGELAAVGATLGITHPTGYPLYASAAHAFTLLPFGSAAFRINLMAGITCALAVLMTHAAMASFAVSPWIPIAGATALGLEPLFWSQATAAEVYGFNLFLISALVLTLARYRNTDKIKWLALAALLFGFGMGNHFSTLFLVPVFLAVDLRPVRRKILFVLLFFITGISSYIYLPLRASAGCPVQWGDTGTLTGFVRHISGAQFQDLMLTLDFPLLGSRLVNMLSGFLTGYNGIIWTLALAGMGVAVIRKQKLDLLLVLAGLLSLLYALTYHIHDIDLYYLPAFWTGIWFFGLALDGLHRLLPKMSGWIGLVLIFLITGMAAVPGMKRCDRSESRVLREFGQILLRSCPPCTVLFFQGDNPMNALVYLLAVEHRRPDITLIDVNRNLKPMGGSAECARSGIRASTFRHIRDRRKAIPRGAVYLQAGSRFRDPEPDIIRMPSAENDRIDGADASTRETVAQHWLVQGDFHCERGDWDTGIHFYLQAADLAHDIPGVAGYAASVLSSRGELDAAIDIGEKTVAAHPGETFLKNNLAYHRYLAVTGLPEAARLAHEAVARKPSERGYLETLVRIELLRGRFEEVRKWMDESGIDDAGLRQQAERLAAMAGQYPGFPMNVTESGAWTDGEILAILEENALWEPIRARLSLMAQTRRLSPDEAERLVRSARMTETVPGAIYALEIQKRSFGIDLETAGLLAQLHGNAGNTARIGNR
ncbi:DUF2723 domain-containing protein [bacterium]|nr:DUF2723 domain-containing protein [candidate division CSSED10-310 bacterium]